MKRVKLSSNVIVPSKSKSARFMVVCGKECEHHARRDMAGPYPRTRGHRRDDPRACWITALACAGIAVLAHAAPARANALPPLPERAFTLGPSAAWVSPTGPTPAGAMLGLDLTYVLDRIWMSAGGRVQLTSDGESVVYPYVEAG